MTTVALFIHGGQVDAHQLGSDVADWLTERGHPVVVASEVEGDLIRARTGVRVEVDTPVTPIDLVVSIGGDGTMLRATARAVAAHADVLGVNLGQLGYLAEIEPAGWRDALAGYLAGDHQITERLLAASTLIRGDAAAVTLPPALNEVVIEKRAMGRTVELGVRIDGEFFHGYIADGVILATPTGSTAYSLSARGPIVAPTHRAILLTAVSPHSLFDRSLVLEPSSNVEVEVLGDRAAGVAVDGEHLHVLDPGDKVVVTAAAIPARFVTFGGRDFHRILKSKFGLSDR